MNRHAFDRAAAVPTDGAATPARETYLVIGKCAPPAANPKFQAWLEGGSRMRFADVAAASLLPRHIRGGTGLGLFGNAPTIAERRTPTLFYLDTALLASHIMAD
jgi:hypothetical protein